MSIKVLKQHLGLGDKTLGFANLAALQTAIGHWSEMMFPLFSILRLEPAFKRPATQFMLLHLKRVHLMEWARAVMSVALGVKVHEDLPPMLMQQESDSVWTQIRKFSVTQCTTT